MCLAGGTYVGPVLLSYEMSRMVRLSLLGRVVMCLVSLDKGGSECIQSISHLPLPLRLVLLDWVLLDWGIRACASGVLASRRKRAGRRRQERTYNVVRSMPILRVMSHMGTEQRGSRSNPSQEQYVGQVSVQRDRGQHRAGRLGRSTRNQLQLTDYLLSYRMGPAGIERNCQKIKRCLGWQAKVGETAGSLVRWYGQRDGTRHCVHRVVLAAVGAERSRAERRGVGSPQAASSNPNEVAKRQMPSARSGVGLVWPVSPECARVDRSAGGKKGNQRCPAPVSNQFNHRKRHL